MSYPRYRTRIMTLLHAYLTRLTRLPIRQTKELESGVHGSSRIRPEPRGMRILMRRSNLFQTNTNLFSINNSKFLIENQTCLIFKSLL